MNFPALGDSSTFEIMGSACAIALSNFPIDFLPCVNQMRPTGAIVYYAIPHLLTDDPVVLVYSKLFMNLMMFAIAMHSFNEIRKILEVELSVGLVGRRINFAFQNFILLLLLVGLIPVSLADLPSISMILLGLRFYYNWYVESRNSSLLIAGLSFGSAISFRQHAIVIVFLILIHGIISKRLYEEKIRMFQFVKFLTPLITLVLLQIILMFKNFGSLWLWVPSAYKPYMTGNKQPFVDMAVWMEPYPGGAYLSQLPHNVPEPLFYLARFFPGLFRFELSPYGGRPPLESVPITYTVDFTFWLSRVFLIALLCLILVYILKRTQSSLIQILVFTGLVYALFNAFTVHTEVRYYLFTRIVLSLVIGTSAISGILKLIGRKPIR